MVTLIVGFSKTGKALKKFLEEKGEIVKIYDDNIDTYSNLELTNINIAVLSPGISMDSKIVKTIREKNIKIVGELDVAYKYFNENIIAITGTNGKTTVTLLIEHILKYCGFDARACGNVGIPFVSIIEEKKDIIPVVEVSSFQLETSRNFRPRIGICLNITEDHLERHKSFENYVSIKKKIFKNQTNNDYAILNFRDTNVKKFINDLNSNVYYFSLSEKVKGVYMEKDNIIFNDDREEYIMSKSEISLLGDHNLENVLAATLCAKILNIPNNAIKNAVKTFKLPSFRCDYIGIYNGKRVYNDSKATNIDATIMACKSFKEDITLIVGGYDKGISYDIFYSLLPSNVKDIIYVGDNVYTMISFMPETVNFNYKIVNTLNSAIQYAFKCKNEIILFSPTTSSFDMYSSYIERGETFNRLVKEISSC